MGIRDFADLVKKTITSWRAVLFMSKYIAVPADAVAWANEHARKHSDAWAAHDAAARGAAAAGGHAVHKRRRDDA